MGLVVGTAVDPLEGKVNVHMADIDADHGSFVVDTAAGDQIVMARMVGKSAGGTVELDLRKLFLLMACLVVLRLQGRSHEQ